MATTIELTAAEKLKTMYELQLIDSQVDEIAILKGELPMEVRDLEDEIAGLQTRVSKFEDNIKEINDQLSKHNANIKEAQALIKKYEKQSDAVKNNREFDALQKELELQKLEIQLSEKRIREAQAGLELKETAYDESKGKLKQKNKDLEVKKVELEKIIEKTDKEEAKLKRKSDRAKKKIEARLLKAYLKIRESYRNGLAVVTVQRNSCGGCFNKIPPQLQLEISQMKKVIACEHCGRVLVDENVLTAKSPDSK